MNQNLTRRIHIAMCLRVLALRSRATAIDRALVYLRTTGRYYVHNIIEIRLTGDTRKIFVSKTVDESNSARVLVGCKPIKIWRNGRLSAAQLALVSATRRTSW